jgi:hypothetical protein
MLTEARFSPFAVPAAFVAGVRNRKSVKGFPVFGVELSVLPGAVRKQIFHRGVFRTRGQGSEVPGGLLDRLQQPDPGFLVTEIRLLML